MLKFITVTASTLLTSLSIASACSVEARIDDGLNCTTPSEVASVRLAYGARSTAIYNARAATNPSGGPKVVPKYRVRRPVR
jgi:hypothetical protein